MVRVTALMDDHASEHKALTAEHGLSYLVEMPELRLLFDCGASAVPMANAHRLGLSLKELDAVVLSHSHYDHAAGYRDLIEAGLGSRHLDIGPGFFRKKFAFDGLRYTDLSAGFGEDFLQDHGITAHVTDGVLELDFGVYLVSGFPRVTPFETIPERFVCLTEDGFRRDDFPDEQCLVLERGGKLYLFVGCSHPGILNMVRHVFSAVFGGTHLVEAGKDRILNTVNVLREMGMETLGLSHCSGDAAEALARDVSGVRVCHLACGDSIFLE